MGNVSNVGDVGIDPRSPLLSAARDISGQAVRLGDEVVYIDATEVYRDNKTPGVRLITVDGEPFLRLSVWADFEPPAPLSIWVKTYSENEPYRDDLLASGFFVDTGARLESGFVFLEGWQLRPIEPDAHARALLRRPNGEGYDFALPTDWRASFTEYTGVDVRGRLVLDYKTSAMGSFVPLDLEVALALRTWRNR